MRCKFVVSSRKIVAGWVAGTGVGAVPGTGSMVP